MPKTIYAVVTNAYDEQDMPDLSIWSLYEDQAMALRDIERIHGLRIEPVYMWTPEDVSTLELETDAT